MMDLFSLDTILQEETLISTKGNSFKRLKIKESMNTLPYQISVEQGTGGMVHGKQSYSFPTLPEAESCFTDILDSSLKEGFERKVA